MGMRWVWAGAVLMGSQTTVELFSEKLSVVLVRVGCNVVTG